MKEKSTTVLGNGCDDRRLRSPVEWLMPQKTFSTGSDIFIFSGSAVLGEIHANRNNLCSCHDIKNRTKINPEVLLHWETLIIRWSFSLPEGYDWCIGWSRSHLYNESQKQVEVQEDHCPHQVEVQKDISLTRWKFRKIISLLTMRWISLHKQGKLYTSCVISVMLYGNETWAIKDDDVKRVECAEKSMETWMCNAAVRNRPSSVEFRRLGPEHNSDMLRTSRLRWLGRNILIIRSRW